MSNFYIGIYRDNLLKDKLSRKAVTLVSSDSVYKNFSKSHSSGVRLGHMGRGSNFTKENI